MTPQVAGKLYVVASVVPYDVPFCCADAPSLKALSPTRSLVEPANITWINKFYDPRKVLLDCTEKKSFHVKLTGLPAVSLSGTLLALAHPRTFVEAHCHRCEGVPYAQAVGKALCTVEDGRSAKGNLDTYIAGIIAVARVSHVELALPAPIDPVTLARCHKLGVLAVETLNVPKGWTKPRWL